jgi:ABC-2 type transport system ATP-binding protein
MTLYRTVEVVLAATSHHPYGGPVMLILPVLVIGAIVYFVVRRHRRAGTPSESRLSSTPREGEHMAAASPAVPRALQLPTRPVAERSGFAAGPVSADRPAISLADLTKSYGARNAVDGLTFSVRTGTICGFIGPNGAGKTTTIRMLLGLITPTAGTATVLGHPISEPASYLARVGAMIEGPAFYPTLSARKNLQVLACLGGIGPDQVDRCLDQVDLGDRADDPFKSFSLGMKQRLGIAAALLPKPELLVLDEPTNGLDPTGIREVRVLLRSLADRGTTVLVSSHLLEELEQICDDVVIIRAGRLLFAGPVGELIVSQQADLVAVPENPDDLDRLAPLCQRAGYSAETNGDGRLHVAAPRAWAGELNRSAMADDITLVELGTTKQSLEDVFFELTEEAQ